jgi:hypothetical protein
MSLLFMLNRFRNFFQMASECGKCGCESLSWRLKLAVSLTDEHTTSKDIVLWEVYCPLLCYLVVDFVQNVAKQLLGDVDLRTYEDRSQVHDQCFEFIGTNAIFKFQIRHGDDQVRFML